jgi:hypothetical protein
VNGIGDLISSVLVGFLWVASPQIAMGFVFATTIVGALVIVSTPEREQPIPAEQ